LGVLVTREVDLELGNVFAILEQVLILITWLSKSARATGEVLAD